MLLFAHFFFVPSFVITTVFLFFPLQDYRQTQHDVKIMVRELNLKYLSNKNK